ncbi:hypothetical protein, partial [Burkholderia cenocepacia]|uniref:hypothetical protein n=1 Tax=Burkholderia cenocepacia TaxID=95486 RepID=UPI0038CC008B
VLALIVALLQPFAVAVPFGWGQNGYVRLGGMLGTLGAQLALIAILLGIRACLGRSTRAASVLMTALVIAGGILGGLLWLSDGFWVQGTIELLQPWRMGDWSLAGLVALFWIAPAIGLVLDAATALARRHRPTSRVCVLWSVAALALVTAGTWSMLGADVLAGTAWIW